MWRVPTDHGGAGESGFSIVELLITVTITVVIMVLVLTALDMNANIARVQSDVSDLQQSIRVSQRDMQRLVRAAGRGGLPREHSVLVTQNALVDAQIGAEDVMPGSDVVTVRGAFSAPVYRVDSGDEATFEIVDAETATLQIDSITRSAFEQPLTALHALINDDTGAASPEPILIVGGQGDTVYAVTELKDIQFLTIGDMERATLTLNINESAAGNAPWYLALSPGGTFPTASLTSVGFATVLEEHRFYAREDFSIPGDITSPPSPKLARARMVPGSPNTLHPIDGSVDIADNVFDLQVALGIDRLADGRIDEVDDDGNPLPTSDDDWLWNDEADDDTDPVWNAATLQHVRLTIVGQAQTADRQYVSPAIAIIENRDYSEPAVPAGGDDLEARRHRRRLLQSIVALRNL